jgi:hypothetical protein
MILLITLFFSFLPFQVPTTMYLTGRDKAKQRRQHQGRQPAPWPRHRLGFMIHQGQQPAPTRTMTRTTTVTTRTTTINKDSRETRYVAPNPAARRWPNHTARSPERQWERERERQRMTGTTTRRGKQVCSPTPLLGADPTAQRQGWGLRKANKNWGQRGKCPPAPPLPYSPPVETAMGIIVWAYWYFTFKFTLINSEDGDKEVPTSLAGKRESGVGSLFVDDCPWPGLHVRGDNS